MPRQKIAGKKQIKASVATGSKASKASAKKKSAPAVGGVKERKFRWRAGTVALREIKKY